MALFKVSVLGDHEITIDATISQHELVTLEST